MTEAYIYDAVRTPRGKGKSDGSLHEITPVNLAAQVLEAVRDRNNIDSAEVEDIAFGCSQPFLWLWSRSLQYRGCKSHGRRMRHGHWRRCRAHVTRPNGQRRRRDGN